MPSDGSDIPENATIQQEHVHCGRCGRCPHGPYWYAYWKEKGRLRKRYIGAQLPTTLEAYRSSGR